MFKYVARTALRSNAPAGPIKYQSHFSFPSTFLECTRESNIRAFIIFFLSILLFLLKINW